MSQSLSTLLCLAIACVGSACALTGATTDAGSASSADVQTGSLTGRVRIKKGRYFKASHAGAVVYLEGVPEKRRSTSSRVVEIRQIDKTFVPEVTVILKG